MRSGVIALFFALLLPVWGQEVPTALRMQELIKEVSRETGMAVTMTGSYAEKPAVLLDSKASKFRDPLGPGADLSKASDFDMTVHVAAGSSDDAAAAQWKKAQQLLESRIAEEFGPEAGRVLSKTNVYPPDQLMRPAQNRDDAIKILRELRGSPSLNPGLRDLSRLAPDDPALKEAAEGFYGRGGTRFREGYKGVMLLPDGADVRVVELPTPPPQVLESGDDFTKGKNLRDWAWKNTSFWSEGLTAAERGGFVSQANQRALELLRQGDPGQALKQMKRSLEYQDQMVRQMGVQVSGEDPLIRDLIARVDRKEALNLGKAELAALERRISQLELDNQLLLMSKGQPGIAGKALGNQGLKDMLLDNASKLDDLAGYGAVMGLVAAMEGHLIQEAYQSGQKDKLVKQILLSAANLGLPVGPGVAAEMANQVIEYSKEIGFAISTATVDVPDFLSGIFKDQSADVGRDIVDPRSIAGIFRSEEQLKVEAERLAWIERPLDTPADQLHRQKRVEQCVQYWKDMRKNLDDSWFGLLDLAEKQTYHLTVPGAQAVSASTVELECQPGKGSAVLARLEARPYGPEIFRQKVADMAAVWPGRFGPAASGSTLKVRYEWSLDGGNPESTWEPAFTFPNVTIGDHMLSVKVHYTYQTADDTRSFGRTAQARRMLVLKPAQTLVEARARAGGKPLGGVNVEVSGEGGKWSGSTPTSGGPLSLALPPMEEGTPLSISMACPGFDKATALVAVERGMVRALLDLQPRPMAVAIRVKDALTDKPIPGFDAVLEGIQGQVRGRGEGGELRLMIPVAGDYRLGVKAEGYEALSQTMQLEAIKEDQQHTLSVKLKPALAELTVKVGDGASQPLRGLGGASVLARVGEQQVSGQTGPDGHLRLAIPAGARVTVRVAMEGYQSVEVSKPIVDGKAQVGGVLKPLAQAPTPVATGAPHGAGGAYSGHVRLVRGEKNPEYHNALTLTVSGSGFQGQLQKNARPYYGIQCSGQFQGTVSDFFDSMSRTVIKDRKKLEGTITGTCESNGQTYPLRGTITGVVYADGTAQGSVDYYAPPFKKPATGNYPGRDFSRFDWSATR